MIKFLLPALLLTTACNLYGQTSPTPALKAAADSTCKCLTAMDISKISNKDDATAAITTCFGKQSSFLVKIADERHVEMTDDAAMRQIGVDIAKEMLNENCQAFLQLSMKLAGKKMDEEANLDEGESSGQFSHIDTKGFNYLVIKDEGGNEKSFLWLRQFPGSGKLVGAPADLAGKRLKVSWKEIEVYLPAAKGYYKVKEITGVDFL